MAEAFLGKVMWRWRYLSSPPPEISVDGVAECTVALTDEFGTEILDTVRDHI